ncbi:MAG: shikimate kinase, partial [Bacteroidota bacterium]
ALNRAGITIYLRLKPGELVHRLSHAKTQRPLLANMNAEQLRTRIDAMLKEREPVYNQAQLVVEGNNLNAPRIKELAERVLAYSR